MLQPQAVIFDIGNVLTAWQPEAFYDRVIGVQRREALFAAGEPSGSAPTDLHTPGRLLHLGCVREPLPDPGALPVRWRSRSNALLAAVIPDIRAAVDQAAARWGKTRVAVVLGVSAAGLQEGQAAAVLHRTQGG